MQLKVLERIHLIIPIIYSLTKYTETQIVVSIDNLILSLRCLKSHIGI